MRLMRLVMLANAWLEDYSKYRVIMEISSFGNLDRMVC